MVPGNITHSDHQFIIKLRERYKTMSDIRVKYDNLVTEKCDNLKLFRDNEIRQIKLFQGLKLWH